MAGFLGSLLLAACAGGFGVGYNPGDGSDNDGNGNASNTTTLEGYVRDASGDPVAGARVLLSLNAETTDSDGYFKYENLLPGNYTISLMDGDGNFDCLGLTLYDGSTPFSFNLPGKGAMLHATGVSPGLNRAGASLDNPLTITFSEDLDPGSVSISDFSITPDIGDVTATVDGNTVIISPELQLPLAQLVLIELEGEILSSDGNSMGQPLRWRFRTSATDSYPPRLIATTPTEGELDYAPNAAVRLEFNEELGDPDAGLIVNVEPAGDVTATSSGRFMIVRQTGGWELNTPYALGITGIQDSTGNRSLDTISLTFTTGEQVAPQHNINPEWHQDSGRIVFSADLGGSYDVFSINPDGTELTQLTALPGDETHPTLSASGNLLAFQYRDGGGNWSIYTIDIVDSGDAVQVTSGEFNDYEPYFSRTISDRLIYVSSLSNPDGLYLMNSDGSDPTEQDINFSNAQRQPALHPLLDTQMLFASHTGDDWDIWRKTVSAIDGSVINQNLTSDMLTDEHHPCWGPDAGFLVYISDYDGSDNVWYAEATGEFARQLTYFEEDVLDLCVSPVPGDQQAVIEVQTGDDTIDLAIIDLVAGEVELWLTGEEAGNQ